MCVEGLKTEKFETNETESPNTAENGQKSPIADLVEKAKNNTVYAQNGFFIEIEKIIQGSRSDKTKLPGICEDLKQATIAIRGQRLEIEKANHYSVSTYGLKQVENALCNQRIQLEARLREEMRLW